MAVHIYYRHSLWPLAPILAIQVAQCALYYKKLPRRVAYKYDLDMSPRHYCSKVTYMVAVLVMDGLILATAAVSKSTAVWEAGIAMIIALVCHQFIFMTNIGGDDL